MQDKLISTSMPVFDLIDCIVPGAVKWDMVKKDARGKMSNEDKLDNAK